MPDCPDRCIWEVQGILLVNFAMDHASVMDLCLEQGLRSAGAASENPENDSMVEMVYAALEEECLLRVEMPVQVQLSAHRG